MSDFKIITDSTADLTPALVRELDIDVLPLGFVMGDKTYLNYPDERELSSTEFYNQLRNQESSTTNQINVATFLEAFESYLEKGIDVLYIAFSSGLSGTYNSSALAVKELAPKYPDRKIATIDSKAASMGEGLMVYNAVQQKRAGKDFDAVLAWVEQHRDKMAHWFTVDDLNHLKRGGRVSGAAALLGTMLGIKPVLHVDNDGHLIPMEKVRGRKQSLDALVNHMASTVENPADQMVFISHGDALEDAQYVEQQVRQRLGVKQTRLNFIGPVIGSHSGPGTIALFFLAKNKD